MAGGRVGRASAAALRLVVAGAARFALPKRRCSHVTSDRSQLVLHSSASSSSQMQRHCVSAVVPVRHDNWGGGLALRAQTTLPHLAAAFDELLLVDFNSQNGTLLSTLDEKSVRQRFVVRKLSHRKKKMGRTSLA